MNLRIFADIKHLGYFSFGVLAGIMVSQSMVHIDESPVQDLAPATQVAGGSHHQERSNATQARLELLIGKWRQSRVIDSADSVELQNLLAGWMSDDMATAFKWLQENELMGLLGDEGWSQWERSVVYEAQPSVVKAINALSNPALRAVCYSRYFNALRVTSPASALDFIPFLPPPLQYDCALSLAAGWASTDPGEAFTSFLKAGPESRALTTLLDTWARKDPQAAFQYVNTMSEEEILALSGGVWAKTQLLASVLEGIVPRNPSEALRLLDSLPREGVYVDYRRRAASVLVSNAPARAAAVLETIPEMIDRQRILSHASGNSKLAVAMELIPLIESERIRTALYKEHAMRQTLSDPQKALVWARSINDKLGSYAAVRAVAENWMMMEPTSALDTAISAEIDGDSAFPGAILETIYSKFDKKGVKGSDFSWVAQASEPAKAWLVRNVSREHPDKLSLFPN